tara:strand:- start:5220 stop:6356 length:1137 start_codon:yes stop_codon:yes gene_type:complete
MKLLHTLKTLLEQDQVIEKIPWHEQVFNQYSWADLEPIVKFFSYDINLMYKELDKIGKGEKFIEHIYKHWDDADNKMHYLMTALGGYKQYVRGMLDNDLVEKYILKPYIDDIRDITISENGKIMLEVMDGEESEFFAGETRDGGDCADIAAGIFSEEGLGWDSYDYVPEITNLIEDLPEVEYIKLIRFITKEYGNKVITPWREEFEYWREEDSTKVSPGQMILTPERITEFLDRNMRYNLAVLISNTEELEELEMAINSAYRQAFNDALMNDYYESYYDELKEFIGDPIGEGTTYTYKNISTNRESKYKKTKVPVKYYDITEKAKDLIIQHAVELDNPVNFLEMMRELDVPLLCPEVSEWPQPNEVSELFIEYLPDYL